MKNSAMQKFLFNGMHANPSFLIVLLCQVNGQGFEN